MAEGQAIPLFRARIAPAYAPVIFSFLLSPVSYSWCADASALPGSIPDQSSQQDWVDALHPSSEKVVREGETPARNVAWPTITDEGKNPAPLERIMASDPHQSIAARRSQRVPVSHPAGAQSQVIGDVYTDDDRVLYGENVSVLLDQVSELITYDSASTVELESFCDDRGSGAYSMVLAEERGRQTAVFLRSLGITAKRISEMSYGKEQPPCTEQTVSCWEDNRRVQKAFQVLALRESKGGCLVRVRVMTEVETIGNIRTSPASAFLKKMHLAEPVRRTATVTRRPSN